MCIFNNLLKYAMLRCRENEVSALFRKILREIGFMLIANAAMFTPVIAAADEGNPTLGAIIGAPIGAVVTGTVLVSMSKQKRKATKADKYIDGKLALHEQKDTYLRTSTSKTKIKN